MSEELNPDSSTNDPKPVPLPKPTPVPDPIPLPKPIIPEPTIEKRQDGIL